MKTNQKFGVALHLLSYLDIACPNTLCTSHELASSINTNPVVVRRILGQLKKAGLVQSVRGKGGTRLLKQSNEITLLEVYQLFADDSIFGLHPNPNQDCPIGAQMNPAIIEVLEASEESFRKALKEVYISDISMKIKKEK